MTSLPLPRLQFEAAQAGRPARPPRTLSDPLVPRDSFAGQLVTLALNGDRRAFPLLMKRHEAKLRRVIARRVSEPEDVGELLQDTWTSAWAALQTWPAAHPFEMWLVCIALNKCRDWGRRRSVRYRARPYLEELAPAAAADPETQSLGSDNARHLRRALDQLPETLRAPLVLTLAHDLRQREVADRLGITTKSVETRVCRAKTRMRQILDAGPSRR